MTTSLKNDEWISSADVPDPEGLSPKGWMLVIRPLSARKVTKGGIIIPDSTKDDMQYLTTVGRVLAMGPLSYTHSDLLEPIIQDSGEISGYRYSPWCQVGDYVTYAKYAGAKRVFKGVKLLFMADKEILDVVPDPHDIDPLYNLGG